MPGAHVPDRRDLRASSGRYGYYSQEVGDYRKIIIVPDSVIRISNQPKYTFIEVFLMLFILGVSFSVNSELIRGLLDKEREFIRVYQIGIGINSWISELFLQKWFCY